MAKNKYQQLVELSKRISLFKQISDLLGWDQETYMPKGAIEIRSKQLELIASLHHKESISASYTKCLFSFIDKETGKYLDPSLTEKQKAALREWRRDYLLLVKLPTAFVEEFSKTTSKALQAWLQAKENNDFKIFQPYLEKIVELSQKKADLIGYENHPYDALLDTYEQAMTTNTLFVLFERLKIPLMGLLRKIQIKKKPDTSFLHKKYPHDKQLSFGKKIQTDMGFDPHFSRLDESHHPMCLPIHPQDIRMTTKVLLHDVLINILSCIHEGGHGLYGSNLPKEYEGTPLCESVSLGIDESQSRTWETLIGRSFSFWEHYFPLLQKTFPENLQDISLDEFYQAINIVQSSMIRTESDEVTYNLHIILRFEIEKGLIEGNLAVSEIPEIWREKMRESFGITPKADSEGLLQDIHWAAGLIGYFPTYTLGNLYAAQFFESFIEDHPDWKKQVSEGKLSFIGKWQKQHIHQYGRQYQPEDLCERVTGKPLSEKPFIQYLENKYSKIYHLS